PGTRYSFTVKARDAADNASPASAAVTLTTEKGPDDSAQTALPTDLQATDRFAGGRHHLDLTWNAPKTDGEITEYQVYVNGKFSSNLTLGASAPKTTANISLPVGKSAATYTVKVRAKL